mmetsp:Transcript_5537/g.5718  ORF Transcript_5537/g.5718 Transcript_5537/m.5718 type:complete len:416 (+) Transcript_5537:217-1464(+)
MINSEEDTLPVVYCNSAASESPPRKRSKIMRDFTGLSSEMSTRSEIQRMNRSKLVKSFAHMMFSPMLKMEPWTAICCPNIIFATSNPFNGIFSPWCPHNNILERIGILSLIRECNKQNIYISKVFGQKQWTVTVENAENMAVHALLGNISDMVISVNIMDYENELRPEHLRDSNKIISVKFTCNVVFSNDCRIQSILMQYNVKNFMMQMNRIASYSSTIPTTVSPDPTRSAYKPAHYTRILKHVIIALYTKQITKEIIITNCTTDVIYTTSTLTEYAPSNAFETSILLWEIDRERGLHHVLQLAIKRNIAINKVLNECIQSSYSWSQEVLFYSNSARVTSNKCSMAYLVRLYVNRNEKKNEENVINSEVHKDEDSIKKNNKVLLMESHWCCDVMISNTNIIEYINEKLISSHMYK